MEVRDGAKTLGLRFLEDGALLVEWCDGDTRGTRIAEQPEKGIRENICETLHRVREGGERKAACQSTEPVLSVEVEHGRGLYRVQAGYVPEEDLVPWQWLQVTEWFTEEEISGWMETI